ncbi:unnamed protein product [Callosobruchus maculatus]|uniref:Uncharacterized protein n=1 Tax=Callosobruchus maculatus TaxID=64391 RepID=A0A653BIA5_CALMS|nr:unnamed protein product [Callosobruchus maculatus]
MRPRTSSKKTSTAPRLLVLLLLAAATLALVAAASANRGEPSIKQLRNAKKGASSSLILGGRFGRSCFFKAGGCYSQSLKDGTRPQIIPAIYFIGTTKSFFLLSVKFL